MQTFSQAAVKLARTGSPSPKHGCDYEDLQKGLRNTITFQVDFPFPYLPGCDIRNGLLHFLTLLAGQLLLGDLALQAPAQFCILDLQ